MSDLAEIAAELYSGPPDGFIAARNEKAKDAADPGVAASIRALKKPSIAAWVVNVFARERADRLDQALQLAQELRDAQADLDAKTLAELSRQRRALTNQLAREAAGLATARGARVTASTQDAVQQTIAAAFFDQDAALAVASGRLVRELEASGDIDLGEAVAGGAPEQPAEKAPPPTDEVKARRERRAAEAAVHEAEQGLLRARRDRDKAESDAADLTRRIDDLTERERALEAQLSDLRDTLESARSRVSEVGERMAATSNAVDSAEGALEKAQKALDQLPG